MLSFLPALLLLLDVTNATPINTQERPKFVPGKYLVQFNTNVDAASVAAHHDTVRRRVAKRSATHEPIERIFNIGSLNAYLGDFDEQAAADILQLDEVLSVVPDEYIYLEKTDFPPLAQRDLVTQSPSIWSLGDLSHKKGNAANYVYDSSAGKGMTAYVFDTGIRLSHVEFEGRARFGINGITNSTAASGASKDDEGHGTHCAATLVGKTFGVAKKASVVDVKIFNDGTVSLPAEFWSRCPPTKHYMSRVQQAQS